MKGFVFTLDALFSLLIVGTAISVLLYFTYTAPAPYYTQYSSSSSILNSLLGSQLNSIVNIPLIGYMLQQSAASNQTWPMEMKNTQNNAGNSYGPTGFPLAFVYNAPTQIVNGTIVSAYGNVYFAAGNVVYAINISSGTQVWNSSAPYSFAPAGFIPYGPWINATVLQNGMLIYGTTANIVALNAYNGSTIWSAPLPYNNIAATENSIDHTAEYEPDQDEYNNYLYPQNGRILASVVDGPSPALVQLWSLYANNGSVAGTAPLQYNALVSMALADGQVLTTSFNAVGVMDSLTLSTSINNNSYASAQIWQVQPSTICSGTTIDGLSFYSGVIAFGCGEYDDMISINSVVIAGVEDKKCPVSGVTIYNGKAAYQTACSVSLFNTVGVKLWESPIYSNWDPLQNSTPVMSSTSVYSLWSDGKGGVNLQEYLVAMNLSSGAVTALTELPYGGQPFSAPVSTNPYMAVASGMVFVSEGHSLMAFGVCPIEQNDSVLSSVATLYLNGQGSCGEYLLSEVQPNLDSGITIDGSPPTLQTPQFDGRTSFIRADPWVGDVLGTRFTVAAWVYPYTYSLSTDPWVAVVAKWYGGAGVGGGNAGDQYLLAINPANGEPLVGLGSIDDAGHQLGTPVPLGKWQLLVFTYDGSYERVYQNGVLTGQAAPGTVGPLGITGGSGNVQFLSIGGLAQNNKGGRAGFGYFDGLITNVQIYNATLSGSQIQTLYNGGPTSPPVSYSGLRAWFPLVGGTSGFNATSYFAGYPYDTTPTAVKPSSYAPVSQLNSFSITSQSVPISVFNYSADNYTLYNVGIYTWK